MKPVEIHGVQTFVTAKGRLQQGRYYDCKTAAEACKLAEEKVRLGAATGAAAFVRHGASAEFDDGEEPVALATFGSVPPGVIDQLPF